MTAAPIHDVRAALTDPHTQHRGMVLESGEYRGGVVDQGVEDACDVSGGAA